MATVGVKGLNYATSLPVSFL